MPSTSSTTITTPYDEYSEIAPEDSTGSWLCKSTAESVDTHEALCLDSSDTMSDIDSKWDDEDPLEGYYVTRITTAEASTSCDAVHFNIIDSRNGLVLELAPEDATSVKPTDPFDVTTRCKYWIADVSLSSPDGDDVQDHIPEKLRPKRNATEPHEGALESIVLDQR